MPGVQLDTLVETTTVLVEANRCTWPVPCEVPVELCMCDSPVPFEASNCTWPVPCGPGVPVEVCMCTSPVPEEACTTLVSEVNEMSLKRPNNDCDDHFSSSTDTRGVKRQKREVEDLNQYKSEIMADRCEENISERTKTERDESVEVRQRMESILDQFLADYKQEEDTKSSPKLTKMSEFDVEQEEDTKACISEEESIENIQKFLDEWDLTPSRPVMN